MELEEYRRMAAVEDQMWFYRALHSHLERELALGLKAKRELAPALITPESSGARNPGENVATAPREILDAGCGTGGLIRRLERMHSGWRWTGIDLEPLACEWARARCTAKIIQGSLTALPFADGSFDAVVCADVLYHLDEDSAALRELCRVLRPGGWVVINVPAHPWLWSYHDVTVHGRRRYTRQELREKLVIAGFAPVRLTHWNALVLPLVVARRKLLPAPASGSDVRLYPAPIEKLFLAGTKAETGWLNSFGSLPFGSSILATARKP